MSSFRGESRMSLCRAAGEQGGQGAEVSGPWRAVSAGGGGAGRVAGGAGRRGLRPASAWSLPAREPGIASPFLGSVPRSRGQEATGWGTVLPTRAGEGGEDTRPGHTHGPAWLSR